MVFVCIRVYFFTYTVYEFQFLSLEKVLLIKYIVVLLVNIYPLPLS